MTRAGEPAAGASWPEGAPSSRAAVGSFGDGWRDLVDGARLCPLWLRLGWLDIQLKYRRTYLGPFWVTASFGLSAAAMTVVFGTLFGIPVSEFIPYLVTGLAVWSLLAAVILDGCQTYVGASGLILQFRLPLSVHVYRQVTRNVILFGHNLAVVVLACLYFETRYGSISLLALPAVAIIAVNAVWVSILLGTVCARYRDLPPLVGMLVNIVFFVTPIFWRKEMLAERGLLAEFNPFFHFIEIVRAPLLGQAPPLRTWFAVAAITAVGWAATLVVFSAYRRRIAYWL